MLYWTDWSTASPAIYRSSVVNPAREMLVNGSLIWPWALTIDFTGNHLHDIYIVYNYYSNYYSLTIDSRQR